MRRSCCLLVSIVFVFEMCALGGQKSTLPKMSGYVSSFCVLVGLLSSLSIFSTCVQACLCAPSFKCKCLSSGDLTQCPT